VARTDLLRRLCPSDPDVFLVYENMEVCLRARRAGVPPLVRPGVALRHRGGEIEAARLRALLEARRP
jgi:N-acetylglucosaminyl-diphospho-decaprenol L-rhamnosyltransferase